MPDGLREAAAKVHINEMSFSHFAGVWFICAEARGIWKAESKSPKPILMHAVLWSEDGWSTLHLERRCVSYMIDSSAI